MKFLSTLLFIEVLLLSFPSTANAQNLSWSAVAGDAIMQGCMMWTRNGVPLQHNPARSRFSRLDDYEAKTIDGERYNAWRRASERGSVVVIQFENSMRQCSIHFLGIGPVDARNAIEGILTSDQAPEYVRFKHISMEKNGALLHHNYEQSYDQRITLIFSGPETTLTPPESALGAIATFSLPRSR